MLAIYSSTPGSIAWIYYIPYGQSAKAAKNELRANM
jgi:hypothetical protein